MSHGDFMGMTDESAWKFLEEMAEKTMQWEGFREKSPPTTSGTRAGIHQIETSIAVEAKIAALARKVEELEGKHRTPQNEQINQLSQHGCYNYQAPTHVLEECPFTLNQSGNTLEQLNAAFQRQQNTPFPQAYNSGWGNHSNTSWNQGGRQFAWPSTAQFQNHNQFPNQIGNQQNANANSFPYQTPPAAHAQHNSQPNTDAKMSILEKSVATLATQMGQMTHSIKSLEGMMSQLGMQVNEREKGTFPSQPVANPNNAPGPSVQINAIHTLRSGKEVDNNVTLPVQEQQISNPQSGTQNQSKDKESETSAERTYEPRVPFPNRLKPKQNTAQMEQMREIFKQTKVNIPLLDAIEQVPAYAKILKDLCTKKRKTQVPKKVFLTSPVTDMMSNSMPEKYSDPGCPTVTCTIGSTTIKRALLDLGAGVNLLPSSVYEQLGIGELKPTKITIQLADRTVRTPRGVVEDVLVKIGEFFFPVDFIVLETAPVRNPLNQTPVILGRPFLATANALIDCRGGVMRLTFGKMTREMNIFKFDGQTSNPTEQAVNMIYQLQADQGKDDSDEEDVEETPQSFEEICNEEIRKFEEACEGEWWRKYTEDDYGDSDYEDMMESFDEDQCWEESQPLEKGRWTIHVGPPIFDEDPSSPVESGWWDPFLEPTRENFSVDKESPGRELWLNSLDVDADQFAHSYNDPFYNDSGSFEHGEWIFDYERKFFGNKNPCSNDIERDKGVECGETVDSEMTDNVVEDDDIKENQFGLENEECCTIERVRWKKKKNARMRMTSSERRRGEGGCMWSDDAEINSMKRTHYQSGKRARGRNRPSLI